MASVDVDYTPFSPPTTPRGYDRASVSPRLSTKPPSPKVSAVGLGDDTLEQVARAAKVGV